MLSAYVSNNLAASRKISFGFSHNVVTAGDTAILLFLVQTQNVFTSGKIANANSAAVRAAGQYMFLVLGLADLALPGYIFVALKTSYTANLISTHFRSMKPKPYCLFISPLL